MLQNLRNWFDYQKILRFFKNVTSKWMVAVHRYLRRKESSLEWWSQRLMSGLLLPLLLVILLIVWIGNIGKETTFFTFLEGIFFSPAFLLGLATLVVGWHVQLGMCEVIKDYVHRERLKFTSFFLIRVLTIQCMKFVYTASFLFL